MEIENLKRVVDTLSTRDSIPIRITSKMSDIRIQPNPPIKLNPDRNYECGLKWFAASNTIFNIDTNNNKFIFSHNNGKEWTTITLRQDAYEIKAINEEIQRNMREKNKWDAANNSYPINISTTATRIIINITDNNYKIDFSKSNTLRDVFGFDAQVLHFGRNVAQNTANITNLSTINVDCSFVKGMYLNDKTSSILYSIPAYTVPVGFKIYEKESAPVYLPIIQNTISQYRIRIVDEDNKLINFNGEEISMLLHIKQV